MAKNIWVCSRNTFPLEIGNKLYEICNKLSPDNIVPEKAKVVVNGNVAFGIMNPKKTLLINGNSLLMGKIIGDETNWNIPLYEFPDGSYALFRDGKEYCEIVSDPVASRTIWYYFNEEIFIASTSQRAIILFIGEFQFNDNVIPWMLSNGIIGPSLSWDKRINCLPPDSSVILNKKLWSITTLNNPIVFNEQKTSNKNHQQKLLDSLNSTFKSLNLNYSDWVLPLSGGYDSRGILCLLKNTNTNLDDLKAITWGLESSLNDKCNDAYIAHELAAQLNISHKYFHTDLSEEPVKQIIDRFLINGEGRIDNISGYMDGFIIWKTLFNNGVQGIIRGDEGFGWSNVSSPLNVRQSVSMGLCTDYLNLREYTSQIPLQKIPKYLEQKDNESILDWRDRLYHEYRLPTLLAALSDLKLSYVEQVNPLLSKQILQQIRKLPGHLRTEKSLFKKIVVSLSPKIVFASQGANAKPSDILKQKQFAELLIQELSSKDSIELFPKELISTILKNIKKSETEKKDKAYSFSLKSSIKIFIPQFLKRAFKNIVPSKTIIDYNILAFRIYIIIRMNKILKEKLV